MEENKINERLNPYKTYEGETQKKQVIFLREVMGLTYKAISEIVGVAASTVGKWCKKFIDLLDSAKKLFATGFEKVGETIKKVRLSSLDKCIKWEVSPIMNPSGYIIEMYDNNKLLWLKVGMTGRPARERFKEHLTYWASKKDDNGNPIFKDLRIKVKALYPAETHEGAEITESALREVYKEKYLDKFIKNDRFLGVKYEGIEKENTRFQIFRNLVGAEAMLEPCPV